MRLRAGERITVSLTLRLALLEETVVTAAKTGERDVQTIPMAVARGVQNGYVRDLDHPDHPDHPLGGDDVTVARGQLRVVFDRRTNLLLSSDVALQGGIPLAFNKALIVKPGLQIDNPPDLHDVRASVEASNRTLQSGASARLTTALTPSTTLVSLTAYRALDYEFFVDSDTSELDVLITRQHERQHQGSEEITLSHQKPRLSWVGGVFLFNEFDHQSYWSGQPHQHGLHPGDVRDVAGRVRRASRPSASVRD